MVGIGATAIVTPIAVSSKNNGSNQTSLSKASPNSQSILKSKINVINAFNQLTNPKGEVVLAANSSLKLVNSEFDKLIQKVGLTSDVQTLKKVNVKNLNKTQQLSLANSYFEKMNAKVKNYISNHSVINRNSTMKSTLIDLNGTLSNEFDVAIVSLGAAAVVCGVISICWDLFHSENELEHC